MQVQAFVIHQFTYFIHHINYLALLGLRRILEVLCELDIGLPFNGIHLIPHIGSNYRAFIGRIRALETLTEVLKEYHERIATEAWTESLTLFV